MIRIIALTEAGYQLGQTLKNKIINNKTAIAGNATSDFYCDLWFKPKPFSQQVQQAFTAGDSLIFICATGIVVRTLAVVLKSKKDDPPVLVLDESGEFVIPLISGHEGGANYLAYKVAALINATPIITTAKPYLQPVYTVGMGCERGCPEWVLQKLFNECLQQVSLSIEAISNLNSIDIKADELGLIRLSYLINKPFQVWNKKQLTSVEALLSTRSDYVYSIVGVYGVAESAALYAAQQFTGNKAELVLPKQKNSQATCAIARSYPDIDKL
ncbi:cobalamin biosynthesis protein [Aliikangiella sp. IMCC44359]|uniref:cobalamin biosynthesis protein n=1 Tax=Aliikangiella sp. IMCC44359 TaxID=3459125 RepID=UPI00403A8CDC